MGTVGTTDALKKVYRDKIGTDVQGSAVGVEGIEAGSDKAIFPKADLEQRIGREWG